MNASQRSIFLILTAVIFGSIPFFYVHSERESSVPDSAGQKSPAMRSEPRRQAQLERPMISGGKAKGNVLPFALTKEGLESSIRSHPMPEVWLTTQPNPQRNELFSVEQDDAAYRVQLPKQVTGKLTGVWKITRSYYYLELFGPQDSESRYRRGCAFTDFMHNTSVELESIVIKTPDGKRPLSWEEAKSLVNLMNDFAKDLLLQADEALRPKRPFI